MFDVFGDHVRTLSMTEVADLAEGSGKDLTPEWQVFSENEASEHLASIAYVARVRLADGRVIESEPESVLAEARKISKKLTVEDLEPKMPPPGRSSS